MRIMTGKYKGLFIHMPDDIRPTQNKVRKAIFDILADIEGLSFLELYAGSGAVSFEALSRGAREAVLAEQNRDCQAVIKKNIALLGLENCILLPYDAQRALEQLVRTGKRFDIVFLDPPYQKKGAKTQVPGAIGSAMHPGLLEGQVSRSLRDVPPSAATPRPSGGAGVKLSASTPGAIGGAGVLLSAAKKTLQTIGHCDIVAPDGLVLVQHFKTDNLPDTLGDLALCKRSKYGDTVLSIYRKS
ncbi:MAG: RsmD family RNA methyltransferase [Candidatus Omnitrophica bacterium]|nr:RsmD family RNA methyltransferase [Candidatus Omnitrophota bacterium]